MIEVDVAGMLVKVRVVEPWAEGVSAEIGEVDGDWYYRVRGDLLLRDGMPLWEYAQEVIKGTVDIGDAWTFEIRNGALVRYTEIRRRVRGRLGLDH